MSLLISYQRFRYILTLALPIIGGMASQNVLNLVDLAMVGTLGAVAVAAVGIASFIIFMAFSLVAGISAGVQATAARRFGEKKFNETALPLNTGLLLSVIGGIPITILLYLYGDSIIHLLVKDQAVAKEAIPFLGIRSLTIAFIGMNFAFRGYWNAVQKAKLYLFTLLAMHSINILLNYLLIFGHWGLPNLGTQGAAIGTNISIILGTFTYICLGFKYARQSGFFITQPKLENIKRLAKLSSPNSIQQMTFAGGLTCLFWITSQIGTDEMAVANILMNITLIAVLPSLGFGLAAASLVGKSLGENNALAAQQWAWDVSKVASLIFIFITLTIICFPQFILSFFLHKPELIELGTRPLQLAAVVTIIDGIGLIIMQALLGAGDTNRVMKISFSLQWGLFLPIAWLIVSVLNYGLLAVWLAYVIYKTIQAFIFIIYWQRGSWSKIEI